MRVCSCVQEVRDYLRVERTKRKIAFVPTMGFLHEGHESLLRLARSLGDLVVLSIYVNPTQFNNIQDLQCYPRDIERDLAIAEKSGVDMVFTPADDEMYIPGVSRDKLVQVKAGRAAFQGLCGATRPGHFDGVVTVVAKLFNIVQPDLAIFGEKDYQQLQVVRELVRDLQMPVKIIAAPLLREASGLAMSSRNVRLSQKGREEAAKIFKGLLEARSCCEQGLRAGRKVRAEEVIAIAAPIIQSIPESSIDYLELRSGDLLDLAEYVDEDTRLFAAVYVEGVRLIDNMAMF